MSYDYPIKGDKNTFLHLDNENFEYNQRKPKKKKAKQIRRFSKDKYRSHRQWIDDEEVTFGSEEE